MSQILSLGMSLHVPSSHLYKPSGHSWPGICYIQCNYKAPWTFISHNRHIQALDRYININTTIPTIPTLSQHLWGRAHSETQTPNPQSHAPNRQQQVSAISIHRDKTNTHTLVTMATRSYLQIYFQIIFFETRKYMNMPMKKYLNTKPVQFSK